MRTATDVPSVAIGAATREALRLVDVLDSHAAKRPRRLRAGRSQADRPDQTAGHVLDKLNTAIKSYLGSLDNEAMTEADEQRVEEILTFAHNLEYAGDIVEKNLMGLAVETSEAGPRFAAKGPGRTDRGAGPAGRQSATPRRRCS